MFVSLSFLQLPMLLQRFLVPPPPPPPPPLLPPPPPLSSTLSSSCQGMEHTSCHCMMFVSLSSLQLPMLFGPSSPFSSSSSSSFSFSSSPASSLMEVLTPLNRHTWEIQITHLYCCLPACLPGCLALTHGGGGWGCCQLYCLHSSTLY